MSRTPVKASTIQIHAAGSRTEETHATTLLTGNIMKLSSLKHVLAVTALSVVPFAGLAETARKQPLKPEDCDILIFEHFRNKDLDAVVSLFEADATFYADDKTVLRGHAAIRKAMSPWIDAHKLEWIKGPVAYVNASNDLAILRGTWAATFKDKDGKLTTTTGKNVELVRKQADGTWRFVIDHATGAN